MGEEEDEVGEENFTFFGDSDRDTDQIQSIFKAVFSRFGNSEKRKPSVPTQTLMKNKIEYDFKPTPEGLTCFLNLSNILQKKEDLKNLTLKYRNNYSLYISFSCNGKNIKDQLNLKYPITPKTTLLKTQILNKVLHINLRN